MPVFTVYFVSYLWQTAGQSSTSRTNKSKEVNLSPTPPGMGNVFVILCCIPFVCFWFILLINVFHLLLMIGSRSQKVPVNKLVRTDSLDPAGRLHAYMQVIPGGHLEKSVTLNAVR